MDSVSERQIKLFKFKILRASVWLDSFCCEPSGKTASLSVLELPPFQKSHRSGDCWLNSAQHCQRHKNSIIVILLL